MNEQKGIERALKGMLETGKYDDMLELCNSKNGDINFSPEMIKLLILKLKKKNESRRELAHDIRTPSSHIFGFLDILYDRLYNNLEVENKEMLLRARNAADKLHNKIGLMFDNNDKHAKLNLLDVIKSSIGLYSIVANKKDINFNLEVDKSLFIHANNRVIRTILDNLVDNAIKFANKTTYISITADVKSDRVFISISNYGDIISTKDKEKIFKKGHSIVGTDGEVGTGTGLVKIKRLLEKENQYIEFFSDNMGLTNIMFTMPISKKKHLV